MLHVCVGVKYKEYVCTIVSCNGNVGVYTHTIHTRCSDNTEIRPFTKILVDPWEVIGVHINLKLIYYSCIL